MVLRLACKDVKDFEMQLARFISTETRFHSRTIAYVDCRNAISPYLFARGDLDFVLSRLNVVRIDRAYDLLDWAQHISREFLVKHCHYLLISPYYHLLEGFSSVESLNWIHSWEKTLARVESNLPLHIVLMEEK